MAVEKALVAVVTLKADAVCYVLLKRFVKIVDWHLDSFLNLSYLV